MKEGSQGSKNRRKPRKQSKGRMKEGSKEVRKKESQGSKARVE